MVNEFDQIGEAEYMYGGNWLDYHLSESTGDLGKIYDPTLNIFKEPMPVDIVGIACSSWILNTNTGIYSSPVANPGVTTTQMMQVYFIIGMNLTIRQIIIQVGH